MKIYLIAITLTTLTATINVVSCSSPTNCSKVKTGSFFYLAKSDKRKIVVTRTDSVQIERDSQTGEVIESKIQWLSNCQYQMFMNVLSQSNSDSTTPQRLQVPINIEIVSVNKDFYVCEGSSSFKNKNFHVLDTLYFMK